jgi:hypothetical protein
VWKLKPHACAAAESRPILRPLFVLPDLEGPVEGAGGDHGAIWRDITATQLKNCTCYKKYPVDSDLGYCYFPLKKCELNKETLYRRNREKNTTNKNHNSRIYYWTRTVKGKEYCTSFWLFQSRVNSLSKKCSIQQGFYGGIQYAGIINLNNL